MPYSHRRPPTRRNSTAFMSRRRRRCESGIKHATTLGVKALRVACSVARQPADVRENPGGELRLGQPVSALRRRAVASDRPSGPSSRTAASRRSLRHGPVLPASTAARPSTSASQQGLLNFYALKIYPYIHGYVVAGSPYLNVGPSFVIPAIFGYKRIYGTGSVGLYGKYGKLATTYPGIYIAMPHVVTGDQQVC